MMPHLLRCQGLAVKYYGFALGRLGSGAPSAFATTGLIVDNGQGFLPVGIHDIGNIGYFRAFFGERGDIVSCDEMGPPFPGAGHELLKPHAEFFVYGIYTDSSFSVTPYQVSVLTFGKTAWSGSASMAEAPMAYPMIFR